MCWATNRDCCLFSNAQNIQWGRVVAEYVEGGGGYLGLCAGAYYACARVEFELGNPECAHLPLPLSNYRMPLLDGGEHLQHNINNINFTFCSPETRCVPPRYTCLLSVVLFLLSNQGVRPNFMYTATAVPGHLSMHHLEAGPLLSPRQ